MNIKDLLEMMGEDVHDKMEKTLTSTPIIKQCEALKKFVDNVQTKEAFKVGDMVERNEFGEAKLRFPLKGQMAIVTKVLENPLTDKMEQLIDLEISVVAAPEEDGELVIQSLLVNSNYYKKIKGN